MARFEDSLCEADLECWLRQHASDLGSLNNEFRIKIIRFKTGRTGMLISSEPNNNQDFYTRVLPSFGLTIVWMYQADYIVLQGLSS